MTNKKFFEDIKKSIEVHFPVRLRFWNEVFAAFRFSKFPQEFEASRRWQWIELVFILNYPGIQIRPYITACDGKQLQKGILQFPVGSFERTADHFVECIQFLLTGSPISPDRGESFSLNVYFLRRMLQIRSQDNFAKLCRRAIIQTYRPLNDDSLEELIDFADKKGFIAGKNLLVAAKIARQLV